MKRMIVFLAGVLLLMSACSSASLDSAGKELEDVISNISDADNKYVLMVKGGYRANDPSVTYEKAFSAFFGTPRWKYFKGTEGQDVVEFTGDCMYQGVAVKARIQFVVDEENGTFEATYLAFNEVPQNALTLVAVISKAFEEVNAGEFDNPVSPSAGYEEWFNNDSTNTEYITLVYDGDKYSWITLYQDGTFAMQVNVYEGYGNVSGTYEETDRGFKFHVEKCFSGFIGEDVKEFEMVAKGYGMMEYQGDWMGTTVPGTVYLIDES